jgi:hypothetical protein
MLPQHLIVEFWDTVKQELQKHHAMSEEAATQALASYQSALDRHQVGDMVYHRDPESVAETIAGGWTFGFSDPPPDSGVVHVKLESPGRMPPEAPPESVQPVTTTTPCTEAPHSGSAGATRPGAARRGR